MNTIKKKHPNSINLTLNEFDKIRLNLIIEKYENILQKNVSMSKAFSLVLINSIYHEGLTEKFNLLNDEYMNTSNKTDK